VVEHRHAGCDARLTVADDVDPRLEPPGLVGLTQPAGH
jgi:hypothetical protein